MILPPQVIPLTSAASQTVFTELRGQACRIDVYTKSLYVGVSPPGYIGTDPPRYENQNPLFLNLFVDDVLIIGGCQLQDRNRVVRNAYFGFLGDLALVDTQGDEDPVGAPLRLPPPELMNEAQRELPLSLQGLLPAGVAGTIPGLGTRWLLVYWPFLTSGS